VGGLIVNNFRDLFEVRAHDDNELLGWVEYNPNDRTLPDNMSYSYHAIPIGAYKLNITDSLASYPMPPSIFLIKTPSYFNGKKQYFWSVDREELNNYRKLDAIYRKTYHI